MANKDRRKFIFSLKIFLWCQYYMTYYMVIRLLSQFYIWELVFDRIVNRVEAVRYILRFDGWAIFGYFMEVSSWCFVCETNWIIIFLKWSTSHIIRPCNKIYATTFVKLYQIIDFGDPVYVLWFTCSQNLLGFPTFRLRASPDECYSKNASCALNLISTFFYTQYK